MSSRPGGDPATRAGGDGRAIGITPALLRDWPLPEADGDKHDRGTVLAVGGAAVTPGALLLTGIAALRAGAGVLQLVADPAVATALAVAVPEARVSGWPDGGDADKDFAERVRRARAVVVGPGLDDVDRAADLLRRVVAGLDGATLVVDAYALGALAHEPELLDGVPAAVLTPNLEEARVLLGRDADGDADGDPGALSAAVARRYRAVAAVRGWITHPDGRSWREDGGDSGLGTGGSGDVLAGVLAGLLARGAEPEQAACWAVHAHATAGQRLAATVGRTGFLARELLDQLPRVLAAASGPAQHRSRR